MTAEFSMNGLDALISKLAATTLITAAREALPEADQAFVEAMGRRNIPVRSGRLKGSLTDRSHRDHVARATDRDIILGSKTPYAGRHRERIGALTSQERQDIYVKPLLRALMAQVAEEAR